MALCRCVNHPPRNNETYSNYVEPLGYPYSSSICGRSGCECSGLIWLTENECDELLNGVKIFKYASNVSKLKWTQF